MASYIYRRCPCTVLTLYMTSLKQEIVYDISLVNITSPGYIFVGNFTDNLDVTCQFMNKMLQNELSE